MTAPKQPSEDLDEQERELARILHALPANEPSPALDARILRAAANAAASSRKPHARWLASIGGVWGVGAAAAAVLALGVSWQMLDPSRTMGERTAPVVLEQEADSAVVVELGETRREAPLPMPGPPAPAAPASATLQAHPPMASSKAVAAEPMSAAAPASDAPTAFPHDGLDEHVAARQESAPQAAVRVAGNVASPVTSTTDSPAAGLRVQQSDKLEACQRKSAEASLASRESAVAGGRADAADAEASLADLSGLAMPASPTSGPMKPATWLAQVRQLLAAHRTSDARASLKLFRKRYPNYVIPADLAPLLRE